MATFLEKVGERPWWQLAAVWVGVAVLATVAWYFLFYTDAEIALEEAHKALSSAKVERQDMETKLANFEVEMEKAAQAQTEIDQAMEVLPQTAASVDHMMRTFQQQGRVVGLVFDSWKPGPEQRLEYYAKSTIAVEATGTWNQLGEFFRKMNEMRKIVSIEKLSITLKNTKTKGSDVGSSPLLTVRFDASTFRFLSEEERSAGVGQQKSSRRRKP
jgi:type IV pilus assembly protein PilO